MSELKPPQLQINPILDLFTNGQMQAALDALDTLSTDYPDDSLLLNIRGACYAGLGQKDAAVESYKKAVLLKPDYAKAHYNLGGAFQEIGKLDEAVKSYEIAIALEPENAEAHNNLGNVLRELDQLDAAIKSYEKALVINPDYVEAYYSLGLTFYDLGQLQDTVKSYKKVLSIKPDFAGMHNNLGNVYRELDELDAAVESYKKAIAIKADFFEAYFSLGIIYQGNKSAMMTAVLSRFSNGGPRHSCILKWDEYALVQVCLKILLDAPRFAPFFANPEFKTRISYLLDLFKETRNARAHRSYILPRYLMRYLTSVVEFVSFNEISVFVVATPKILLVYLIG